MPLGEREQFVARIQEYMTKAVHEAKVNLSWINQNPEYVEALTDFIARVVGTGPGPAATPAQRGRANPFLEQLERFLPRVQFFGAINSLAQVLLKITSPGTPDFYQGTELLDLNLVDPDNRLPVDFAQRRSLLIELDRKSGGDLGALCDELLANLHTGAAKLWTTMRALRFRREHAELFQAAACTPLYGAVEKQEHVVAFARTHER